MEHTAPGTTEKRKKDAEYETGDCENSSSCTIIEAEKRIKEKNEADQHELKDKVPRIHSEETISASKRCSNSQSLTPSLQPAVRTNPLPFPINSFSAKNFLFLPKPRGSDAANSHPLLPPLNSRATAHETFFSETAASPSLMLEYVTPTASLKVPDHQYQILLYRDRNIVVFDPLKNEISATSLTAEEKNALTLSVLTRCPTCGQMIDPATFPFDDKAYFHTLRQFFASKSKLFRESTEKLRVSRLNRRDEVSAVWESDEEQEEREMLQAASSEDSETERKHFSFLESASSDDKISENVSKEGTFSHLYPHFNGHLDSNLVRVAPLNDDSSEDFHFTSGPLSKKREEHQRENANEIVKFSRYGNNWETEENPAPSNFNTSSDAPHSLQLNYENPFLKQDYNSQKFSAVMEDFDAIPIPQNISRDLLNTGYYKRLFVELKRLGFGSNGQVYLCAHILDHVNLGTFAVKKMPVGDDKLWFRKMLREVKIRENLRHPNIVDYKHSWLEMYRSNEFCPWVPWLFVLMEYCNANTLENLIWDGEYPTDAPVQYLSDSEIWKLLLDILSGLQYLHHCGILHRDMKTSNILINYAFDSFKQYDTITALLTDFGTAERMNEKAKRMHRDGYTGTMEYTAPELLEVDEAGYFRDDYDEKSDMWSVGIIAYAMCYAQLPYVESDPKKCRMEILQHTNLSLPQYPKRSSSLQHLILALTSRDPKMRPSTDDIFINPAVCEILWNSKYLAHASELLAKRLHAKVQHF